MAKGLRAEPLALVGERGEELLEAAEPGPFLEQVHEALPAEDRILQPPLEVAIVIDHGLVRFEAPGAQHADVVDLLVHVKYVEAEDQVSRRPLTFLDGDASAQQGGHVEGALQGEIDDSSRGAVPVELGGTLRPGCGEIIAKRVEFRDIWDRHAVAEKVSLAVLWIDFLRDVETHHEGPEVQ